MTVTVRDIARAAGVGRTTVLRALWDRPAISMETKARVLKIAAEMKYRPNHIARSLVMGQSHLIGLVTSPSVLPGFESVVELVANRLREAGYAMLFHMTGGYGISERECIEELMNRRVEGVIAIPDSCTADSTVYDELLDSGIRLVLIDRCFEGLRAPQVVGDNYRSARLVTEYLISLGHQDIVHLSIPQLSYVACERYKGFSDAMTTAGFEVTPSSVMETGFDERSGAHSMQMLLRRKKPPTAIVARNDLVARGAMRSIYAAGLSVPEDISIVGNGDIPGSDVLRSPLTTVRYPVSTMVEMAIERLLSKSWGHQGDADVTVMDADLIVRSSCAPPRKRSGFQTPPSHVEVDNVMSVA
ncbi:MAG: LacI family DNA-binding transcriptional regulator [Armatimonadota bacterium]